MTAIKIDGLERFLKKPDSGIGAILIYGEDQVAVRDLAKRTIEKVAGRVDDPFAVVTLDDAMLSSDAGKLADEIQSMSLMGGVRVVWVRGAGAGFAASADAILEGKVRGNLVVAEAGALAKTSSLRVKFEENSHAFIVPLYEATSESLGSLIESTLQKAGLRIDEDAKFRLIGLTGTSPVLIQRELEKLASYCLGRDTVTLQDVEAVSGDALDAEIDELIDAALGGNIAETDRYFSRLVRGGSDGAQVLLFLHRHLFRLIDFKQATARGTSPEQAVRSARPMIFFKRQPAVIGQVRTWPSEGLLSASSSVQAAILQTRLSPELAEAHASRAVLALARNARALQTRLN